MKKESSVVILCVNTDLNVLNFYTDMFGTCQTWKKTQWFAFADPEDLDYIRIATTVQIRPPCQLSKNEYEKSWHIETANTRHVDTYKDFKHVLEYLMNEYIKRKKELRELLIRKAAHGYET